MSIMTSTSPAVNEFSQHSGSEAPPEILVGGRDRRVLNIHVSTGFDDVAFILCET